MTEKTQNDNIFKEYQPIVYKIDLKPSNEILESTFDILFSNNIAYPELCLGFLHFIHRTKDKMEEIEKFANRKKVYLVTSLFEKNIDKKEKTENGLPYASIDEGTKQLIKTIVPNSPAILSRAFLKLWEMIAYFDLIPNTDKFVSGHLAEGPGSFIQATILYRDMLQKLGKIKSSKNDKFYAVTIHSDNEHLSLEKDFINYYSKEKPQRLNIVNTVNKKELSIQRGGIRSGNLTDGDITNLHTINLFGGSLKGGDGFAGEVDFVTADGGFDWKKENLQEQEAYRLIFGQILTALKIQKSGGNFVLKIFESYTKNTIKIIELLRVFYNEVYICKPFTSRISNSEKYIVCIKYNKKLFTSPIAKKMEEIILTMNNNEGYNIVELFSNFILSDKLIEYYKNVNIELSLKQYEGINKIMEFIHLDNYNGNEYNMHLDRQIEASTFWNNVFLNYSNFKTIHKYITNYKHVFHKTKINTDSSLEKNEQQKLSRFYNVKEKSTKLSKISKIKTNKTKSKPQKGGGIDSDIEDPETNDNNDINNLKIIEKFESDKLSSDMSSINSNDEYLTKLTNEVDVDSDVKPKNNEKYVIDLIDDNINNIQQVELNRIKPTKSKKSKKSKK